MSDEAIFLLSFCGVGLLIGAIFRYWATHGTCSHCGCRRAYNYLDYCNGGGLGPDYYREYRACHKCHEVWYRENWTAFEGYPPKDGWGSWRKSKTYSDYSHFMCSP